LYARRGADWHKLLRITSDLPLTFQGWGIIATVDRFSGARLSGLSVGEGMDDFEIPTLEG
jgi:hypothetical protein